MQTDKSPMDKVGDEKIPLMAKILLVIVGILLILCVFCIYADSKYKTINTFLNKNDSDCIAKLPPNLSIVYSDKNKRYAVLKTDRYSKMYLWGYKGSISDSYAVYDDFSDSCLAKSFALQYLREQKEYKENLNSYK